MRASNLIPFLVLPTAFLVMSACSSAPHQTDENRNPASAIGGPIALTTSEGCNRIDPISSPTFGRWRERYSLTWEADMVRELHASGEITRVSVTLQNGDEAQVKLELGNAGKALASSLTPSTYFERRDFVLGDLHHESTAGFFIASYNARDGIGASTSATDRANNIIIYLGSPDVGTTSITCQHVDALSQIGSSGCFLIDGQTVARTKAPLCFSSLAALQSYENSF